MSGPQSLGHLLVAVGASLGLLGVGVGSFLAMPESMLRSDYLKALVPALLVVLAALVARLRQPEAGPS